MSVNEAGVKDKRIVVKYLVVSALTVAYQIFSVFAEKNVFTVPPTTNLRDYISCRIISCVAVWFLFDAIYDSFIKKDCVFLKIVKIALPYAFFIVVAIIAKNQSSLYIGDEVSLYYGAAEMGSTTNAWLYYLTPWFYMVSDMLVPCRFGPIIVKGVIEFLVTGYVMYRTSIHFGNNIYERSHGFFGIGSFMILPFLLQPVYDHLAMVHRLPTYVYLCVLFVAILVFDRMEEKTSLNLKKMFFLALLCVVLTQWRVEGIYWLILGPIVMLIVYKELVIRGKSYRIVQTGHLIIGLAAFLLMQYLVQVPQYGFAMNQKDPDVANQRMFPFYIHAVSLMYLYDLDREANEDDLYYVDNYISLEGMDNIFSIYGDFIILEPVTMDAMRGSVTEEQKKEFYEASKRIIIHNPMSFLRAQWRTFRYTAENGDKTLLGKIQYNLYVPCIIAVVLLIVALIKRRWLTFFIFGGVISNWFIVFVLAPAAYFKYYFPVYMTPYFFLTLIIISTFYNAERGTKEKIIP